MRIGFGVAALALLVATTSVVSAEVSAARLPTAEGGAGVSSAPVGTPAAEPPASRGVGLERCLALAMENYPQLREAEARYAYADAQRSESRTAPYSDFTGTAGVGLAPTVFGTGIYSPNTDVSLSSNMALAWRIGASGVVPLWTFGEITSTWEAADANVDLRAFSVLRDRDNVEYQVFQAYYGLQLARASAALVDDARSRIRKYVAKLEKKVAEDEADEVDLIKIRMDLLDLDIRSGEAMRRELQALSGLRFLTGVEDLEIPGEPLVPVTHALLPLGRYVAEARVHRPEMNMARAGVRARRAQLETATSKLYPKLGLTLAAEWARAPEVADQQNPFVQDGGNYLHYGFAFAMRWRLDFLPAQARVEQARAAVAEVEATEKWAFDGTAADVARSYADAYEAFKTYQFAREAVRLAKQWLVQVQQGIDVGTLPERDITAPAREYAFKRYEKLSAVYDFNLAVAALARATGWDEIQPALRDLSADP